MEKRQLGTSREKVPAIGMGTWEIGDTQREGRKLEMESIRRGVELGMALIDTAEMYGHGRAESLVGEAVKDIRDKVFIASKVSPEHLGYDDVIRSCEASISRLGVKDLDLYMVHWPNPRIPIDETMKAMEELVSKGRIRYVGVSNFSVAQTERAREALPRSEIVSNEVRYSLTHRSIESELLPFCEREKITVIAYSPLDTGRVPATKMPKALAEKYRLTPAQLMLNWVTHRDRVIAIPKASKVGHTEENAASLDKEVSEDDYQALSRAFE